MTALATLQLGYMVSGKPQPATGSERYYRDLIRALPEAGVDVRGLVVGDPGPAADELTGVDSFAPEGGGAVARIRALRRAVVARRGAADVIVSHHAQHALPVLDLIGTRPLVVHFHGPLVREGRAEGVSAKNLFMRGLAERLVYRRGTRFIVLSQAFGAFLQRDYGVPVRRIDVIPGGVNLERFSPAETRAEARALLGWPAGRRIVFSVRRLAATKGLEALIDALDAVRRRVPDALLVIAGRGPLQAELERRVAERELAPWVRFAGYVSEDDLPRAYRAADCTIVPSVALEGFGLVVVESLACGTPALVTPVTGLPEVVRDLDPALILAGADAAALATGMIAALSDPNALPDADACRAYAQRFDWRTIAGRIRDVYASVA